MARFACIRAEVEKRRAEVAMDGNDKIRIILDVVVLAHNFHSTWCPDRDFAKTCNGQEDIVEQNIVKMECFKAIL